MDLDYDTFPGFFEASYYVSPLGDTFPGYGSITSYALPDHYWDLINCEIYIPYDSITGKSHDFFCGYTPGTNNFAILGTGYIPYDTPKNSHSYRFRNTLGLWYGYYFSDDHTKLEFGFNAYIRVLRNNPPRIYEDHLPNTYSTGERFLYVLG